MDRITTIAVGIARSNYDKDLAYRRWNATHGGVYVPVTESMQPNPYLDAPGKVVTTTDGRVLTLVNPAYMTRQVQEMEGADYGVKGHITSLNPVRPGNSPDEWEARVLKDMSRGKQEVSEVADLNGSSHLRYMRAVIAEERCLKCHAWQGYKLGDVRGGISVSVPMASFMELHATEMERHAQVLLALWIVGCAGILYGRSLVSHQIERRAALHASAVEARLAAEAASRSKSEFLAAMSHEVRTPLSGLMGMLQLLSEAPLPREQAERADMALESSRKLLAIINDILDLSRVESGLYELVPAPVRPSDVAESVAGLFAKEAARKGLELKTHIHPSVRQPVLADGGRLAQMLINLLGNAVKYTDEGSVSLTAYSVTHPDPLRPRVLVFEVRDNGPGIAPEHLSAVFSPFTRLEAAAGSGREGAGLGLAIVSRLTRMMGGEINVDTAPGQGCALYLSIPVRPAPEGAGQAGFAPRPEPGARAGAVLLVEDEKVNRLATKAMLEKLGHAVTAVASGPQALEAVRAGRFDVALMDVRMEGMDGVRTLEAIRELPGGQGRELPVLAFTAQAMGGDRERFLAAGFDGYLPKPAGKDDLARAVAEALASGRRGRT